MPKSRGKTRSLRIILCLETLLLLASFMFQLRSACPLSIEEEQDLGQKFLREVRTNFEIIDDDFANEYINGLGQYLARSLETKHFPFHYYIINDQTLNAFAGPAGHIFVFTGLIDTMESADELAAVMSHEIAHVSARHLSNRLEENKKINLATVVGIMTGILLGGKGGSALVTGSMAAGVQAQLAYSREDERQADQLGVRYMTEAGFDPRGMIPTLKRIQDARMLDPESIPPYLLTHPLGPERIANIEIMLEGIPKGEDGQGEAFLYRKYFPHLKTILRARYSDPKDSEREFKKEIERNPDSALAHLGLGLVYKRRNEFSLALRHLQEALKREPNSKNIALYLGEVYQLAGQDDKAIPYLLRAIETGGNETTATLLLAKSYQNLGQHAEAIALLEKLTTMVPVKPEVFYSLGISYGKQNRLAQAHYFFGIYFKNKDNREKALFHLNRADELARGDPVLKKRIKRAIRDVSREP